MEIEIRTLADVTPHLPQDAGLFVAHREGYSFVDYSYVTDGTFANSVAQQCRGLKFDEDGRLIARPFHKFFNIGEREDPSEVDWSGPHVVMDKLDGSMVHPAQIGGKLVLMTRKGLSAQARAAEAWASDGVWALSAALLAAGRTPIFEYTAPDNQIVINYPSPALTLLAVRDTVSGRYAPIEELRDLAATWAVPVVQVFEPIKDIRAFIRDGRALEGQEGRVVAFADGTRYKLKADAYVLRHRALAGLAHEKDLMRLIAEDGLDDVLPLLPPDVAARAHAYRNGLMARLHVLQREVQAFVETVTDLDRRQAAERITANLEPRLRKIAFMMLDGKDPWESVLVLLASAGRSSTQVDAMRDLLLTEWTGIPVGTDA
ncbi:hypothetical protein JANAI62_32430 [Jannaschia pagri]|uniref:T4 RNA ligase 1-like N-terminal domain-containing protein n=1 Tax=Jannaschia pagri TaxID=2829797 RepID=A0ABQ4NQC9_9RHOB|nr:MULTISPECIES: RNA ligase [unclassified Jannaschia]GIT92785.1 hypothetical protein JANAI61_32430 [Jannaschia sp. AI_61]GIT96620.1 hypothetical protein JANAI62_32430 [Jannaschia sp. AI_62]